MREAGHPGRGGCPCPPGHGRAQEDADRCDSESDPMRVREIARAAQGPATTAYVTRVVQAGGSAIRCVEARPHECPHES